MDRYERVAQELRNRPKTWLVTGAAGFIGSHITARLLSLGQHVLGLDNLSTGNPANLPRTSARFRFLEADICDWDSCAAACERVDVVLHLAALGSVPRSLAEPLQTHRANVDGFLNVVLAARDARVRRVVYSSSSSVYGDDDLLPKREERLGRPLSPYAATKRIDEIYATVTQGAYGVETIGLRYFNVFGPRQDPGGAYAAVIPRWIQGLLRGQPCQIYGDGLTSRDFCFVDNVVQANLLAATAPAEATDSVYNIGCGEATTLADLYNMIRERVASRVPDVAELEPSHEDFRPGDVRHSLAAIERAEQNLGYRVLVSVADGLTHTVDWFAAQR